MRSISLCGISGFSVPVEGAHLIPKREQPWYNRNGMIRYGFTPGLTDVNNVRNILCLRADLHSLFDSRMFAIVPKNSKFATHILSKNMAADYWPTYHNVPVRHLHDEPAPFLFARFAWAILLNVTAFVLMGLNRSVIQVQLDNEGRRSYLVEILNGDKLISKYGGGGSQNATPLGKRGRSGHDSVVESDDSDSMDDDFWDGNDIWDDKRETWRRRQQNSSEETALEETDKPILTEREEADLVEAAAQIVCL
jgi:hypothetical protein